MNVLEKPSDPPANDSWLQNQWMKWKRDIAFVLHQARTLTLVLKDPRTPWLARLIAGCSAAYLFSPIQIIPTFIPIIGQVDDLFVLFVGMKLVRKLTPAAILEEYEAKARTVGVAGPEQRRSDSATATVFVPYHLEAAPRRRVK